jgi:hypothetical protein
MQRANARMVCSRAYCAQALSTAGRPNPGSRRLQALAADLKVGLCRYCAGTVNGF